MNPMSSFNIGLSETSATTTLKGLRMGALPAMSPQVQPQGLQFFRQTAPSSNAPWYEGFSVHAQRFLQSGVKAWHFPSASRISASASGISEGNAGLSPSLQRMGQLNMPNSVSTSNVSPQPFMGGIGSVSSGGLGGWMSRMWQGLQQFPQKVGQVLGDIGQQISTKARSALQWAKQELAKGITEKNNQSYISQAYSRGKNQPWCADFVSTAYQQAGGSPFGHQSAVRDIWAWGQKNQRAFLKGTYTPQPGDLIIFDVGGSPNHIGIVESVEGGKVKTIEGNSSDALKRREYPLSAKNIRGYVRPEA